MTLALVALAVTQPLVVGAFVWLLHKQNERMWREIQVLCNRIQSPETAVAQTLVLDDDVDLTPDTESSEMTAHERMLSTFTDGS